MKLLLSAVLMLAAVSMGRSQTSTNGDWTYTLNASNEATITRYSGSGGAVTIPSSINGNPVKQVGGNWLSPFGFNTTVTSVTIPDGVTSIGYKAFEGCRSLTSVSIPDSVTSIGDHAFAYCDALTNMIFGSGVTNIGSGAFYFCASLTSVTIGSGVTSIGDYAFRDCYSLAEISVDQANPTFASVSGVLFDKALTTLIAFPEKNAGAYTIPNSVTRIRSWAFSTCAALTSVTIPDSVTSIGDYAFYKCTALTSVTIPDSVTSIGDCAFFGCDALNSVNIPSSVTSIGNLAFRVCYGLTEISVDQANPTFASVSGVLFDKALTTLIVFPAKKAGAFTIPEGVTSIGERAFQDCDALTSVNIPSSVTSIDQWAFGGCNALTSVTIPDSVTSIGQGAFYSCTSLASVTIGNGVTSIGSYAFYGCTALTGVTIPDSVTSIGDYAFVNCDSLQELYFLGNAPSVGWDLFGGISLSGNVYYITGTTGWQSTFDAWPTQELSVGQMVNAISAHQFERGQSTVVTNPSAFGLFTLAQYNASRTNGQADVTSDPSAFNLFTQSQFDDNRTAGRQDVIASPTTYGLYDSSSIMDLRMGGLMIQKQGMNATVIFQPQTTTDLTLPFTNNGTPITNEIPMPGNKGFIRIQANP